MEPWRLRRKHGKQRVAITGQCDRSSGLRHQPGDPRLASPYLQLAAYLPANLGLCACWLLNGSMMADICDSDELESGRRREGMFSAVSSICYKDGIAAGALFGNYLLQWSGVPGESNAAAAVVSLPNDVLSNIRIAYPASTAICDLGAAACMLMYPLTRERMREIRDKLEA